MNTSFSDLEFIRTSTWYFERLREEGEALCVLKSIRKRRKKKGEKRKLGRR